MNHYMEQMKKCDKHLKEATRNKDYNMALFWASAALGFLKKARRLLESGALLKEETE